MCWSILREMSISDLAERPFKKLSGGQQRLVSIAQTLVCDPKVLILDEPTANLELQNEFEVLELIGRYTTSRETTTIMTLHDLNMAARHSQKLVLREPPPLIEVVASWSISLTRQVSPGSEGRSDLVSTKATLPC